MVDFARDTFVDLEEVAKRFGVDTQTVRNWTKETGDRPALKAFKVGRLVRTTVALVNQFIDESNRQESLVG